MNSSQKSYCLLSTSTLAIILFFCNSAHALQETWESRALAEQGIFIDPSVASQLQQQALLATEALDGDTSLDTVTSLPAAVSQVKSRLGLGISSTITNYIDILLSDLQSTGSPTDVTAAIAHIVEALGGSSGGIYENTQTLNALLDGVQDLSGLTSFTVATPASDAVNLVSMIGNDGTAGQTYSVNYSSPLAAGETITLVSGGKTITFVNNSGGTISSAHDLATYLAGAYPANFVISLNTAAKLSALSTLLAGVNGGASGVNTSVYGQAITVKAASSSDDTVNALLDGVHDLSGLSSFTMSSPAVNNSGTVSIVGNDGTAGRTYSLTFASSIASGATFTLTHSGSGNTITFFNNSGGSITTAGALATYLASAYPATSVLSDTMVHKATAVENALGGANYSAMSNASALDALLLTNPTGVVTMDVGTVNGLINGTASGSTIQARLNTLFSNIDGSNGSSGNINSKLSTQITALEGSATQLSTAISDVNAVLGGSGTTIDRSNALDALLLASPTGVLTTDVATVAGEILISPSGVLETDVQTVNGLLNGTATGSTIQARIGSPTIGGSGSNLVSVLGGAGDVATLIGDPGSGHTIIDNLGGSSVQDGLNTLSTSLVGNTNFSSSLVSQISSINSSLDGGLSALPGGATFAGVGTGAVSDGSGGVNIIINSGLGGGERDV